MITAQQAKDRLVSMGINVVRVGVRGSDTFNIIVDLDTDNYSEAYRRATKVWKKLEAAGVTMLIGGHVDYHKDGFQALSTTVNFRNR